MRVCQRRSWRASPTDCLRAGLLRGHYKKAVVPVQEEEEEEKEGDAMEEETGTKGKKEGERKMNWTDARGVGGVCAGDECPGTNVKMTATIGKLLRQPDYGGNDYEDGSYGATVQCPRKNCEYRVYLTGLCSGQPDEDRGKFHNHCTGAYFDIWVDMCVWVGVGGRALVGGCGCGRVSVCVCLHES